MAMRVTTDAVPHATGPQMIPLAQHADWTRILAAARRSLERTGGRLDGTVSVRTPTEAERRLIIGITGVHRSADSARLVVRLADLDAYLVQAYGCRLAAAVADQAGSPLRDRPADRRREALARDAALRVASGSTHANQEWFQRWLSAIRADGTLTRIVRSTMDLATVIRVLDALPADDLPLPVFAERVLANTKALADAWLRGLALRAIAIWQRVDPPATAEQERALWESVGVIPDDLASQVLVLNLPATGGIVGGWLSQAAQGGVPVRVTLHQLRLAPLEVHAADVYVVENPGVLRAATALGAGAPALICTEGTPSAAAHRLLGCAPAAVLHWRNDFDWPGVRMTAAGLARYPSARPWRMSTTDYQSALGHGPSLVGPPSDTPWDPDLARHMHRAGQAVMEERLLPTLLDDLRRGP
jgi:uncharacterized protein (TIGR02679 family)